MSEMLSLSPLSAGNKPTNLKIEVEINELKSIGDNETPLDYQGMFRILHQDFGDKRIVWDRFNLDSVREAKELFSKLIEEGFVPYRIDAQTGDPTEIPMSEFDVSAEEVFMEEREIVMAPVKAAVGG